jgi:hypothetical protein
MSSQVNGIGEKSRNKKRRIGGWRRRTDPASIGVISRKRYLGRKNPFGVV